MTDRIYWLVAEDCDSESASLLGDERRLPHHPEFETVIEQNLICSILMLDVVLKQMELQDVGKHVGLTSALCHEVFRLLKSMVTATWIESHNCTSNTECSYCESSIMWHQLCLQLIKFLSPTYPAHPPDVSFFLVNNRANLIQCNTAHLFH